MVKNMGTTDRIVRVVVAALIAILYFANVISGALVIILGIVALIFLVTSAISFCPLYVPFKFSTRKKV